MNPFGPVVRARPAARLGALAVIACAAWLGPAAVPGAAAVPVPATFRCDSTANIDRLARHSVTGSFDAAGAMTDTTVFRTYYPAFIDSTVTGPLPSPKLTTIGKAKWNLTGRDAGTNRYFLTVPQPIDIPSYATFHGKLVTKWNKGQFGSQTEGMACKITG